MKALDKTYKNNKDYYLFFISIIVVFLLSVNTDWIEFSLHEKINIPLNFFYFTFGLDILVITSWIFILLFRKIGIILFPIFVITHFGFHFYYLSTFLYSDMTVLFLFTGFGLLAIIPRWNVLT